MLLVMKQYLSVCLVAVIQGCNPGQQIVTHEHNRDDMQTIQQYDIVKLVKNNDTNAVKKALDMGADVHTTDHNRHSLLLLATENNLVGMAEPLIAYGADVNQQADNKDTPFLYAGATGRTDLLKLFIAHGPRFDIYNRYNGTALIPACERGYVAAVRLLANTEGFPIDHINRLGWTALLEAVLLGNGGPDHQQCVQILKDAGADINIADKDGVTPLQHARQKGYKEIVRILEK